MTSRYLTQRQIHCLERMGDVLLPGASGLPAFSHTRAVEQIDRILAPVPAGDRSDLKLLLTVLSVFPDVALRGLFRLLASRGSWPAWCRGPLRLLDISLRGLIFTLYYNDERGLGAQGESVHAVLGYQVHCEPKTLKTTTPGGPE